MKVYVHLCNGYFIRSSMYIYETGTSNEGLCTFMKRVLHMKVYVHLWNGYFIWRSMYIYVTGTSYEGLCTFMKQVLRMKVYVHLWNGYFVWRSMYICDNISLNYSSNEKSSENICKANQNTHFTFSNNFSNMVSFF